MLNFLSKLYLNNRFFWGLAGVVFAFLLAFAWSFLLVFSEILFVFFIAVFVLDCFLLFRKPEGISARRISAEKLSNGDQNELHIIAENHYSFKVHTEIIDEMPFQFQVRDISFSMDLESGQQRKLTYQLRPTKRGEYEFGSVNVYASTSIGLVSKRYSFDQGEKLPVYPSYLQMRKYELLAISNNLNETGVKKIRRIGHSMEFEQIKNYVRGDDYRTINWKATARKSDIMVNHYTEEKSQQVISVIDKGRLMRMPFEGLSLLDYAINTSLVISNIAIKRDDKAGLITFSDKLSTYIPPDKRSGQMLRIQEALYKQKTQYLESDYELLLHMIRKRVKQRSLLLLYTNFESVSSMNRQMDFMISLAKFHVVVVIFFKNTELDKLNRDPAETLEEVYIQTIGKKFAFEKKQIVRKLRQHGIYSILTTPADLTVNTINKYLELKSRGTI